jgi:periplasmic protein CpxP/Spy
VTPQTKEMDMTDIDHETLQPEPPLREPQQEERRGFSAWTRSLLVVGGLTAGLAIGVGSLALAAGSIDAMHWNHGARLAIVQHVVARALDSVGATAAQEDKVHDIIAANFADIAPNPKEREAMRKQALDLLGAPTIDRAAVEKLRADAVANFDAKSKKLVSGVLDIADQLNPQQRAELAAHIEQMAQRWPRGGHGGHSMDGGPHDGDAPDGGPDSGPNKD